MFDAIMSFIISFFITMTLMLIIIGVIPTRMLFKILLSYKEEHRAYSLLCEHISTFQKITLCTTGKIYCRGEKSRRIYSISIRKNTYNVFKFPCSYCLTTWNLCPKFDQILTQYLMIKYYEDQFLKIANKF